MFKEFKKFIAKGNVMDLAVGVIMGEAFGKIVSSLVSDVLMPVIGMIIGGIDFTGLSAKIGEATISYGNFIQNVIDFLIVAFCIFIMVRFINRLTEKVEKLKGKEEAEEAPAKPDDIVLLEEIRDLLKEKEEAK